MFNSAVAGLAHNVAADGSRPTSRCQIHNEEKISERAAGSASVETVLAIPFIAALLFGFAMIVSASIGGMTDTVRSFYSSRGRSMLCEGLCVPQVESGKILPLDPCASPRSLK